jgi:hypothetical protein
MAPPPIPVVNPQLHAHPFTAWTEALWVSGVIRTDERLSDVLNARDPIRIEQPSIVAHGAPRTAREVPIEVVLDPFDFEVVLGRAEPPELRAAHAVRRIHKVRYPVVVHGRNFEVEGQLHLFAGNAPEFAAHLTSSLFLPLTDAVVRRERRIVSDPGTDVVLINRYAVRTIQQLDTLH